MTIRKIGLTVVLCFVAFAATKAQSFIITKSADTLRVYNVEIGYTSVYFKQSRDKEAPLERLSKTKIDHLILTDGQQFTFEGRTPVKEENRTFSVLLRGDRGEVAKKEKKSDTEWSFANKQSGLYVGYALLWEFNDYDEDCDNATMGGISLILKLPFIEFGLYHGSHENSAGGSHSVNRWRMGAHYTHWFKQKVYFDLAFGYDNVISKPHDSFYGAVHAGGRIFRRAKWFNLTGGYYFYPTNESASGGLYGTQCLTVGALFKL